MFRRALPPFPQSAHRHYMPLTLIGRGGHGHVVLCLPRSDTQLLSANPNQAVSAGRRKLRKRVVALKVMEEDQQSIEPTCDHWASDILRQMRKLEQAVPPGVDFAPLNTSIGTEILAAKKIQQVGKQTAHVHHRLPIITDVHVGCGPWCSWYSMEYVPGCKLRQLLLHDKPLPAWLIAHIFLEIFQGL
ncbi:uncharacterized protein EI97DRAFT_434120 [Westerdykella ornata]|uniref:Protein kinase domain-containing protein n=1 Tax=Westerdykella ornata TaxID=318751 RepID=A0A6A6JGD4_WESOR|nr:uncharacterized protein EI97DRAFT_434120 [Westerdykella ornata]KAF2275710.1 hypothetical protein EI97DRAFT_434120 [Westerdykella ornata]